MGTDRAPFSDGMVPCSEQESLTNVVGIYKDGVFKPADMNFRSVSIEDMGEYLLISRPMSSETIKAYKKKPKLRAENPEKPPN